MGSWKIMEISLPRILRSSDCEARRRSLPFHMICPLSIRPGGTGMSPKMLMAVMDLPEPDSPTMPSTSPALISKLTPSTARTTPASV